MDMMNKIVKVPERDVNKSPKVFTYDSVFDESVGQCEVYDKVVQPLVEEVLEGYNCTVFAYGQTGTGKTYTMEGSRSDPNCSWQDDPQAGIIPRALDQLFEMLNDTPGDHTVGVSYMELYNENLYDLLSPNDDLVKLNIYEDNIQKGKVKVGGLAEISVHKKSEIYDVLQRGSSKRQTAATKLNACSSRSHTIFAVTVRMKDAVQMMNGEEVYRIGKLNLVDLAGSENIGRSGAVDKRATEAGNINKSLLTLGRVITSLVEKSSHIPYRESKLTRLLQDSLGGRTKTSIIATISPNQIDYDDTLSTLEYAQRAKKITNKPECNQKMSKMTVLKEMTLEIERLRRDLEASRGGTNAFFISKDNLDSMEAHVKELEDKDKENTVRLKDLEEELEKVKTLFGETSATLEEKLKQLKKTEANLAETESVLQKTKEVLTTTTTQKEEQEHLVKYHFKTEKKLLNQAKILKSVATTSTNHVEKLHSKVSRVKRVAETNLSILQNFSVTDNEKTKKLESIIEEGSLDFLLGLEKQLTNNLLTILDSVGKANHQVPVSVNQLTSMIKLIKNSLKEKKERVDNFLTGVVTNSKAVSGVVDENEKKQIELISSMVSQTSSSLNDMKNAVMDSLSKTEGLQTSMKESLILLKEAREEEIKSISDLLDSQFNTDEVDVTLLFEEMKRLQETQRDMRVKKKEMMAEVDRMDEVLQKQINALTDKISRFMASIPSKKDKTTQRIQGTCDALSAKEDQIMSVCHEADGHASLYFQSIMDKIQASEAAGSVVSKVLIEQLSSCNSELKQGLQNNTVLIQDKLTSEFKSVFEDEDKNLDNLNCSLEEQLKKVKKHVEQTVTHTNLGLENLKKDILADKLRHNHTMTDLKEVIAERRQAVESLMSTQLRDESTGQTPQKTSFTFPNNLVMSSPHDRVLDRFRSRKNNDLAALEELSPDFDESLDDAFNLNEGGDTSDSRPSSADSQAENKNAINVRGGKSKLPKLESSFGKNSVKKNTVVWSMSLEQVYMRHTNYFTSQLFIKIYIARLKPSLEAILIPQHLSII